MPDRHEWLAGVPCWVDTSQPDPTAATEFYGGLFGWDFEDRMPEGSDRQYFVASLRGRVVAAVGSQMDGGGAPPAWTMYVAVDDADATAAKVRDAGGTVLAEPFDVGEAGRMAVFADPAGAVFSVWQAGETKGVEAVNEHGSWNFSGLNTTDRAGAEGVLSRGVRLGAERLRRRERLGLLADAWLRGLPRAQRPGPSQAQRGARRARPLRGRRRDAAAAGRRRRPAALEHHLRGGRRRRRRRAGHRARRLGRRSAGPTPPGSGSP
jgi:predicted enzyme related to lactoylglutathione lyase